MEGDGDDGVHNHRGGNDGDGSGGETTTTMMFMLMMMMFFCWNSAVFEKYCTAALRSIKRRLKRQNAFSLKVKF